MPENKSQEHAAGETTNAYGSIKIAEEAVASIVSLAAAQIKGVAAMSGSMAAGLTEKLGKKNLAKGGIWREDSTAGSGYSERSAGYRTDHDRIESKRSKHLCTGNLV